MKTVGSNRQACCPCPAGTAESWNYAYEESLGAVNMRQHGTSLEVCYIGQNWTGEDNAEASLYMHGSLNMTSDVCRCGFQSCHITWTIESKLRRLSRSTQTRHQSISCQTCLFTPGEHSGRDDYLCSALPYMSCSALWQSTWTLLIQEEVCLLLTSSAACRSIVRVPIPL